jgi:hypothetical protein
LNKTREKTFHIHHNNNNNNTKKKWIGKGKKSWKLKPNDSLHPFEKSWRNVRPQSIHSEKRTFGIGKEKFHLSISNDRENHQKVNPPDSRPNFSLPSTPTSRMFGYSNTSAGHKRRLLDVKEKLGHTVGFANSLRNDIRWLK